MSKLDDTVLVIIGFLLLLWLLCYPNWRLDRLESQFEELKYEVHSFEIQQTGGQWTWPKRAGEGK